MKTLRAWALLGAGLLSLAGALLPGCAHEVRPLTGVSERAVAFVGVNVVPMDSERVLADHTVIVRNGLITSVGPSAEITVPPDAERIDARGRYLMPGLADFHVHLHSDEQLLSYLAHGVTTLFELDGSPHHVELRQQLANNQRFGPMLYTSGPLLDGGPPGGRVVQVATPEQARIAVVRQKLAGYDALKVYDNITPEVYAILVAMARQQHLPVVGHVPRTVGVESVLRSHQALISHGEEYFLSASRDESRIAALARATKEGGTSVVPDLVHIHASLRMLKDLEGVFADPEARYLSPEVLRNWRYSNPTRRVDVAEFAERERAAYPFVQHLTLALQKEGVRLLLGTNASDAGLFPGRSTHLELSELVEVGLTPYEALSTGTRNAVGFIKEHVDPTARFGTVAVGQRADLLLLPGNPLEDVGQADRALGVMVRGQWLTREQLQKLREKSASAFAQR
jgi:imidazolonepropionase-like amidohydrolase